MRILITGAGGMLGADVARAARAAGHEVVALPRSSLDITSADEVSAAVRAAAPGAVVNCAAWTDVDGAESDPAGAAAVNGAGAGHVAAAATAAGAWTVHVSTDYVFDGRGARPYVESHPTNPVSVYGSSKLDGERAVAQAGPGHTIVRTAWLFGTGGRCFPRTIIGLARERDELEVVDDQVGAPTFTGHLAPALVDLAVRRRPGILHVTAAGACSWFEFAREILAAAGAHARVRPVTSERFPRPARRPAYSVLGTERDAPRLPEWRAGLRAYLNETAEVVT